LISFDSAGKILVSQNVSAPERKFFQIGKISLRMKPNARMAHYLAYHWQKHGFKT